MSTPSRKREAMAEGLITRLEGCKLVAYQDSGHKWTIGYGTRFYPNGSEVKEGESCNKTQAIIFLSAHLSKYVFPAVEKYDPLPDQVFAALSSFFYNVGYFGSSVIKSLEAKDWVELARDFKEYVYDELDGKKVFNQGLANRRQIEIDYFLSIETLNRSPEIATRS